MRDRELESIRELLRYVQWFEQETIPIHSIPNPARRAAVAENRAQGYQSCARMMARIGKQDLLFLKSTFSAAQEEWERREMTIRISGSRMFYYPELDKALDRWQSPPPQWMAEACKKIQPKNG